MTMNFIRNSLCAALTATLSNTTPANAESDAKAMMMEATVECIAVNDVEPSVLAGACDALGVALEAALPGYTVRIVQASDKGGAQMRFTYEVGQYPRNRLTGRLVWLAGGKSDTRRSGPVVENVTMDADINSVSFNSLAQAVVEQSKPFS